MLHSEVLIDFAEAMLDIPHFQAREPPRKVPEGLL